MASWPLVRKARSAGRPMTADLAGSPIWAAGIHSRAPTSACPVPSRTYARCTVLIPLATLPTQPRYCRFTPAVRAPALTWPVSSIAPTARAAPAAGRTGGLIQPGHREPAHHPHRRNGVPHRTAEQPLGLIRRPVARLRGDRPPVAFGDLAHHRGGVLARLQPRSCPREARPQQCQQLGSLPAGQRGAYPGGSSRLRFCCPHKHMIDRRLRLARPLPPPCSSPGQSPNGCCRTRRARLSSCLRLYDRLYAALTSSLDGGMEAGSLALAQRGAQPRSRGHRVPVWPVATASSAPRRPQPAAPLRGPARADACRSVDRLSR